MRIEKNKKTPENENENFVTEKIKPILEEEKTFIFLVKQWVLTHRLNSRQKLLVNPVNLTTVIAFLPLVLGFSKFLNDTSGSSQNLGRNEKFFAKTLPVFSYFKPKTTFETFEYISKSNKRVLPNSNTANWMFAQGNYGVTLKKPSFFINKQFNGLSCDFSLLTSRSFSSKTSSIISLSRKLDELPAYTQGLKQIDEVNRNPGSSFLNEGVRNHQNKKNSALSLFSILETENKQVFESKNQQKLSLIETPKIDFSPTSILTKKLSLVTKFKNKKPSFSNLFLQDNQFYKDRFDFYKEKCQFNNELQSNFTEKHFSCFSSESLTNISEQNQFQNEFSLLKFISTRNFQVSDEILIETILQELQKKSIPEDVPNFRFMSGYRYPDMTTKELFWFYSSNPSKKHVSSQISVFNESPATSREYSFNVQKFPEISIETNKISVRNPDSTDIFYTGPGLILDSRQAFDWKTISKENFRSWFNTYVSPLNPLIQSFENFFGLYKSPKFEKNGENSEFSDFSKTALFSVKATSSGYFAAAGFFDALEESVVRFSPSSLSFQFPSNSEVTKTNVMRTLELNLAKNQETDQFFTLPVLQLQHPISSSVGSEKHTLSNYSSYFSFTNKGNPDFEFSTDFFTRKNFVNKYTSGSYTKTASIFSKTRQLTHLNVDNWEPLTSTWWLIVAQLSFAFFIFHVLKSLADNYGRELLGYLLDLIASLGILDDSLKQEIEILLGQRDKGFRVVLKSKKNFKDIVGIQKLLPEIYEVVWFLRNSARDFSLSKTLPRGILLTGPPGTGKTLLVQALAGEAQVPVVVLSGSSLIEPGESGALKLEKVFQEARELAPCIVFIDEIDTLAQKRSGVVQNPMGPDELVEALTSFEKPKAESPFERLQLAREKQEIENEGETFRQNNSQEEQLSLLTQFLIELDGIQGRDGVIVIGATNRPEVLDPALLRPGRLEKILQVGLPGHTKRVEILQFYGQGLGYDSSIPWNYLGDRTTGFTAADLATLMNESTIKAILSKTNHTIETIEHGIDRLTTSESEKYTVFKTRSNKSHNKVVSLTVASKMSILRLAYYQAGKIVLSCFLETHPKSVVASLWPRRPTIRSAQIATNLQNSIFEFARLCEITDRLVGCYSGKAAEVLFVQQFSSSQYVQLSTLGLDDLLFAQKLVYCILEKWSFYSKKSHIQQTAQLASNINTREFREIPEKLDLYTGVVETIQIPPMSQALEIQTSSLGSKKKNGVTSWNAQMFYSIPWWQQQTSSELEFVEKNFTNWSRLYLSNPEQSDRNPEWLPPDEFYHSSSGLKNIKTAFANIQKIKKPLDRNKKTNFITKTIQQKADSTKTISLAKKPFLKTQFLTQVLKPGDVKEIFLPEKADFSWNEVALLTRDYPGQSLVLESFNKALSVLNQNRELLDRLVVELLYKEILRQPDIEKLIKEFDANWSSSKEKGLVKEIRTQSQINQAKLLEFEKENNQKVKIVESSWGSQSRKPAPRWLDFAQFSGETT